MSMNFKQTILLLGAGGHARACIDVIELEGRFAIAGLVGMAEEIGTSVLGYPVLGADSDIPDLLVQHSFGVVSIGQIKTPELRIRLYEQIVRGGQCPSAIVSPRSYVSPHARVGSGTVILHGAVINAGAVIGQNCIVNSQSLVEHDAVIGDHCHIATGARVNSGVRIGNGSFIGSGCTIRQGLVIGRNCVIGMGLSVLKDCVDGTQLPAKRKST
jgi:sugar O-acyltransferase (sialic acid O-acetyltransferase NeuD family)